MKTPEDEDLDRGFAEAWKRWAAIPPRKLPPAAATEVMASIEHRPSEHRWGRLLATAAALLLAVGGTVLWKPWGKAPAPQPVGVEEIVPMGKGEVLIWLDEQTPLYMTFQAPADEPGNGGKS